MFDVFDLVKERKKKEFHFIFNPQEKTFKEKKFCTKTSKNVNFKKKKRDNILFIIIPLRDCSAFLFVYYTIDHPGYGFSC